MGTIPISPFVSRFITRLKNSPFPGKCDSFGLFLFIINNWTAFGLYQGKDKDLMRSNISFQKLLDR